MNAKKKESRKEPDEPLGTKISGSWEFRTGKFILRIVAALFFLSYLGFTAPAAWTWGKAVYYKSQPLSSLEQMVEADIRSGDQSRTLAWARLRPEHERADIQEKLLPYTASLDSFFFLMFSHWAAERLEIEETVFWHFFARYRLRFDALRCGAPDSVINMEGLLALMPYGYIQKTVEKWPHLTPMTIHKVLEHDAHYPADNDPMRVCDIIYRIEGERFTPAAREHWSRLRHTLRAVTEYSLSRMDGGTPPPETGDE